jgi:hypothetical protein
MWDIGLTYSDPDRPVRGRQSRCAPIYLISSMTPEWRSSFTHEKGRPEGRPRSVFACQHDGECRVRHRRIGGIGRVAGKIEIIVVDLEEQLLSTNTPRPYRFPPPCIYLFPATIPAPRNNPNPRAQALDAVELLSAFNACSVGRRTKSTRLILMSRIAARICCGQQGCRTVAW